MAKVTLSARDGSGKKVSHVIDTDKPEEIHETVEGYAELYSESLTGPLHDENTRLKAENAQLRGAMASEIMRVEMLTAPKGEDGKPSYDADAQKLYYLGDDDTEPLQTKRLCLEFDKAIKTKLSHTKATSEGTHDGGESKDDPYVVTHS